MSYGFFLQKAKKVVFFCRLRGILGTILGPDAAHALGSFSTPTPPDALKSTAPEPGQPDGTFLFPPRPRPPHQARENRLSPAQLLVLRGPRRDHDSRHSFADLRLCKVPNAPGHICPTIKPAYTQR